MYVNTITNFMAGQRTPSKQMFKALNKAGYFWGGTLEGGRLTSHHTWFILDEPSTPTPQSYEDRLSFLKCAVHEWHLDASKAGWCFQRVFWYVPIWWKCISCFLFFFAFSNLTRILFKMCWDCQVGKMCFTCCLVGWLFDLSIVHLV